MSASLDELKQAVRVAERRLKEGADSGQLENELREAQLALVLAAGWVQDGDKFFRKGSRVDVEAMSLEGACERVFLRGVD